MILTFEKYYLTGEENIFDGNPAEGVKANSEKAVTFGFTNISSELFQGCFPVEYLCSLAEIVHNNTFYVTKDCQIEMIL